MELSIYHLPLAGYFGLIAYLLTLVSPQLLRRKQTIGSLAFIGLALLSLTATWTYMALYFQRSFTEAALRRGVPPQLFSTSQWLQDVSLFNEAWTIVCEQADRWWWSEQLCIWTIGPLLMIMAIEGKRQGISKLWVFMLLGQVVAVSFAQSLFFAALALAPAVVPKPPAAGAPASRPAGQTWALLLALVAGCCGTIFIPHAVGTPYFLPTLLGVHLVALVPLLPGIPDRSLNFPLSRFYFNFSFIALRLRWSTVASLLDTDALTSTPTKIPAALLGLLRSEWDVLWSHPAQSSISWDVVFASLSAIAFMVYDNHRQKMQTLKVTWPVITLLADVTPLLGVATTMSLYLAMREGKREAREKAEEQLRVAREKKDE
ncbi:hypothetical protein JCM21900_004267 [Sporobolomyces salmonicolor]